MEDLDLELQEYQITEEELKVLSDLAETAQKAIEEQKEKFNIQGYYDQVNALWQQYGQNYGFDWSTVQESARGGTYLLAVPLSIIEGNIGTEEESYEEYFNGVPIPDYFVKEVRVVVKLFEDGCYLSNRQRMLEVDKAFLALKRVASHQTKGPELKSIIVNPALKRATLKLIKDLEEGMYVSAVDKQFMPRSNGFILLKSLIGAS